MADTVFRIEVVSGATTGSTESSAPSPVTSPGREPIRREQTDETDWEQYRDQARSDSNKTKEDQRWLREQMKKVRQEKNKAQRDEDRINLEERRRAARMQREDDAAERQFKREEERKPTIEEMMADPEKRQREINRTAGERAFKSKFNKEVDDLTKQMTGVQDDALGMIHGMAGEFGFLRYILPYGMRRLFSSRMLNQMGGGSGGKSPSGGDGIPTVPPAGGPEGAEGAAAGGAGLIGPIIGAIAIAQQLKNMGKAETAIIGRTITSTGEAGAAMARGDNAGAVMIKAHEIVDNMNEVAQEAGPLAAIFGDIAKAGLGVVESFGKIAGAFIERGRELQPFSPSLTMANVSADIRAMQQDFREAQEIGPSIARLTEQQSRADAELREILLPIKKIMVEVIANVIQHEIRPILQVLKNAPLMQVIRWLARKFGDGKEDDIFRDLLDDWIKPMARRGEQKRGIARGAWRQNDPMVPIWK